MSAAREEELGVEELVASYTEPTAKNVKNLCKLLRKRNITPEQHRQHTIAKLVPMFDHPILARTLHLCLEDAYQGKILRTVKVLTVHWCSTNQQGLTSGLG
jgi:hypothetical protein